MQEGDIHGAWTVNTPRGSSSANSSQSSTAFVLARLLFTRQV